MIPKKLHFTWFSNDPYPPLIEDCIKTWTKWFPDYEIIHWDMEKIASIDNLFLKQAIACRKWAFAADFIRLYALYTEGGIYLDTDVEVYKSFDNLLHNRAFIGREYSFHMMGRRAGRYLTSHCMGAEKGHPFIKACLDYYNGRPFILSHEDWLPDQLKYDQTILPYIQTEIAIMQGYNPSETIKGIQIFGEGVAVYPKNFFDCLNKTKNTYCRHLAMGGWRGNSRGKTIAGVKDKIKGSVYASLQACFGLFKVIFIKKI